jgi:hypothetical protein
LLLYNLTSLNVTSVVITGAVLRAYLEIKEEDGLLATKREVKALPTSVCQLHGY